MLGLFFTFFSTQKPQILNNQHKGKNHTKKLAKKILILSILFYHIVKSISTILLGLTLT